MPPLQRKLLSFTSSSVSVRPRWSRGWSGGGGGQRGPGAFSGAEGQHGRPGRGPGRRPARLGSPMAGTQVWAVSVTVAVAVSVWVSPCPGRAAPGPRRPSRACPDRAEEQLEQLYGRLAAGLLAAFHHTLQPPPGAQTPNATCPAGPHGGHRLPLNLRTISPWAYRISHEPSRYPRYLPEAYCLCRGCLTGLSGEEEDLRFRSTPVYVPTVVLRRTAACAGGRAVYVEDYITVPVGCTCVPEPAKGAGSLDSSPNQPALKQLGSQRDQPAAT
ncbi:interleukin-17D isoform X2 [Tachyglossus aculeatus]|uniref:interleukin-17D isoform X2 n=1 Tax=Tachyglossus aculeatus TaxID=9261 RepID=UPI0018F5463E|nr:interleukin-17D isoform X2 [Tachyglossus aculeatus]